MGTENRPPLARIPTVDFNEAVLSYGSAALADAKQDSVVILPYLQDDQQPDPTGVSSLAQPGPFTNWGIFNSATKLTSGLSKWRTQLDPKHGLFRCLPASEWNRGSWGLSKSNCFHDPKAEEHYPGRWALGNTALAFSTPRTVEAAEKSL